MSDRKITHDLLRNIDFLSTVGKLHVDKLGVVDVSKLSDKQVDALLTIPHFKEIGKPVQKQATVQKTSEAKKVNASQDSKKINLYTMKLAELKDFAKKNNIKLTSEKRNDIIGEIKKAIDK